MESNYYQNIVEVNRYEMKKNIANFEALGHMPNKSNFPQRAQNELPSWHK